MEVVPSWSRDNEHNSINHDDGDLNARLLGDNSDRAISTDRSSLESRTKKERLNSVEFEESPRKLSVYIDLHEAARYLNPYHLTNIGIFASYLAVGFGIYLILIIIIIYHNHYHIIIIIRYVFYTNTIKLLYGL